MKESTNHRLDALLSYHLINIFSTFNNMRGVYVPTTITTKKNNQKDENNEDQLKSHDRFFIAEVSFLFVQEEYRQQTS